MANSRWVSGATRQSQVFHTLMPTLPVKPSVCPQLYNALKWNPVLIDVSLVKCSNFRISFLSCQWARGHATAAHDCTANRWMCVCCMCKCVFVCLCVCLLVCELTDQTFCRTCFVALERALEPTWSS